MKDLPTERLENQLPDKAPLYSHGEAVTARFEG